MSLSGEQLLTVAEAIHDKCALADHVDFVFPTGTKFKSKDTYWDFVDSTKDTQKTRETDLVNAVWISYLRFEDSNRDEESFVKTIFFEITVFTEHTFQRLDESASLGAIEKKASKTDHEHDTTVFALQGEFSDEDEIDLSDAGLADCHTNRLAQIDDTQREAVCEFIADKSCIGSVTKLECQFITRIC